MKKLFKTSLVILASLGLVGCNRVSDSSSSSSEPTSIPASSADDPATSSTSSVTHSVTVSCSGVAKVGKTLTFTGTYDGAALTKAELAEATFAAAPSDILTFTGNTAVCAKAGTAEVTMTYKGVSNKVSVTVSEVTKISSINSADTYEVEGVITAMNSRSSIVSDETGSILVYGYTSGAIGDYVTVSGTTSKYNLAYQFSSSATVTKISDESSKPAPVAATALTKEIADGFATYSDDKLVTPADVKPYTWRTKVGTTESGGTTYTTLNFEGSDVLIEPAYLSTDITLEADKYYDISAYFIGYSTKYSYASVLVTEAIKSVINPTAVSVTAADSATSLYVEGTLQLSAAFTPSYATVTGLTWTSSDETKATVSATGLVTGVAAGEVTITATSTASSDVHGSITLTVKEATAPVTGVALNKTTLDLFAEKSEQLTATVTATVETGFVNTVTWTSSDTSVATVANDGTITAVAAGSATITATTDGKGADGNSLTATCALTVISKYGDATHPRNIADVKTIIDAASATDAASAIGPVFIKGVVESSSYDTSYKNYSIWLQSDDGNVAKSFDIERTTLDESVTGDYTAEDALRGRTIVVTGYAYKYNSNYQLYTVNNVSPKLLSVADTAEAEVATFSLNYSKYTLDIGKTVSLKARTYPAQAPAGTTTWATSDQSIATVSDAGLVTAVAAGSATITATNGAKTATCTITVNEVEPAGLSKVETSLAGKNFTLASDSKSASYTDGVVTYETDCVGNNYVGSTASKADSNLLRVYKGNKLTISISSGTLYKLEFTCVDAKRNSFASSTITNGTLNNSAETSAVVKANDNVTSVTITMTGAQSQISKVVVKYMPAAASGSGTAE